MASTDGQQDASGAFGQRIRPAKIAELVASDIRYRIVRREIEEGDSLPHETELMGQYGISRPTLREAFRVLESESLLTIRRGARGGARVLAPNHEVVARHAALVLQYQSTTLGDVDVARLTIEPAAAALFAKNRRKSDLVALRERLDLEQEAVDSVDPEMQAKVASRIHGLVIERCGNRTLALFSKILGEIVEAQNIAAAGRASGERRDKVARRLRRAHHTHERLLELIEAQDAEEAETFWRTHLSAAAEYSAREATRTVLDLFSEP